ncbi:MAG: shikimate dehydrogenase [Candidatus Latescibacterota bacterium]
MISGRTRVLGVIAHPVAHTSSPAMHNAALAALGLDYVYVPFHVAPQNLPAAVAGMRALEVAGLNVTVPHKQAVIPLLDQVSEEARAIGAVNTIAWRDGRLWGDNTDAYGVLQSLAHDGGLAELPPRVVLLGAGGAARAVLYALLQRPEVEEVLLLNRTLGRAQILARDLGGGRRVRAAQLGEEAAAQVARAGLLINATSAGMHPQEDESPVQDPSCLQPGMVVLDIVYRPLRTRLMAQAQARGARAANGLGMLAYQGARSFEIWTGQCPPVEVMLEAALAQMAGA